ncbi:MAG: CsgG/HfaB family protein [Myxococcota bacterium]
MTIRVPKMNPAEVNLAGYRRVGVGTIRGKGGEEIRADLTTALVRTGRFDVLERQELDALIEEQDLGASGRFDDETVASIGHLLGTAAIVLGAIGDADYTESLRREKKTCSRKERDPKTKKERTVNYRCDEYVRTARAALRANLKVVDTESGLVLAAKTLNSSVSDQAVDQFRKPAPFDAKETWLAQCRARIIAKFMRVIAPYETEVFVRLKEDGDLPQLERGNNYAKIGNWRAARDSYLAARAVATNDAEIEPDQRAKVLYNLGVAVGYSGSFDEAIQLLEESYILDPDSYTEREIHRMREFKLDAERLEKQRRGAVES